MRIHLPTNHFVLEILGAVLGMVVALLVYLAFQQYSFGTLRGSLVSTTASSSSTSTDANASIQAAGDERTAARDQLTADRLAALAIRHPASETSAENSSSLASSPAIDAPTVPGNLTAAVSERERLILRAAQFPTANRVGGSMSAPAVASSDEAPVEVAGTPVAPQEVPIAPTPVIDQEPASEPIHQPLPQSGPAENGILLLAFAAAMTFVLRRQRSTQAAD